MNAIKLSVQNCVVELKAVCIFNVVPPVKKHETVENPIFPYLGSDQDRKMYVLYFNACLQKKCKENEFTYFYQLQMYKNHIYQFRVRSLNVTNYVIICIANPYPK